MNSIKNSDLKSPLDVRDLINQPMRTKSTSHVFKDRTSTTFIARTHRENRTFEENHFHSDYNELVDTVFVN